MKSLREFIFSISISEPQKSRLKAGVIDKEGFPTHDGKEAYIKFLMEQDNEVNKKFDSEIVKGMVQEIEKENK